MWRHFQPREGPSRGLLRDYEPLDGTFWSTTVPGHRDRARVDEVHHEAQLGKGHPLRVPQDDHLQQETVLLSDFHVLTTKKY